MKFLIMAFLLIGCSKYVPLYKAGQCFNMGPIVTKILKVNESTYTIEVSLAGLMRQKINRPIKELDEAIGESGIVVEACEEE